MKITLLTITALCLYGCTPTDQRMREIAESGKAMLLNDAAGNAYVATHISSDNWRLVPANE